MSNSSRKARFRATTTGSIAAGLLTLAGSALAQDDVIVSHGFTNFGTLQYDADFAHLNYVNPDAPKGGEISVWAQGNFDSFNRYTRKGVAASLSEIMHERLMTGTADDPYGAYCYLCTTLEYPESRDWVIFNLRDDVTFSDGTPMKASDVKFTFDLFMEQGLPEYVAVVQGFVTEVEVLGDYRLKFHFAEDAPRREVIGFAGSSTVFSEAWFAETGARIDESTLEPFLGTGPYVISSYDIGRQIVYGRNENFWGAAHPFNIGRNNFDEIRVEYFADSTAAFEGFKAGEYTFRNENSSKTWATSYDFPKVQDGQVVVTELPDGTIGTAQSWVFNLDREIWQDPSVREAVRMMFNFEWSNEALFFGLYERVNSFWENSELEATGTPSPEEVALLQPLVDDGLLDASILTDPVVMAPGNNDANNAPDRRVRRSALRMMAEAGWEVDDQGRLMKDGAQMELVVLSFSPAFDRIINPFVENLKLLGIDAKLDRVDVAQYIERRRSGDFDLVGHSFSMGYEPGVGLRQWYGSETADDSSRNLMRLRDPAVDRLIGDVVEAVTLESLATATHALDRVLRAKGFWVQQWFKDVHTVAFYDQYEYPDPLPPLALGQLDFWWFNQDKHDALVAAGALR